MQLVLAKLSKEDASPKPSKPTYPPARLTPAQEKAYQAWTWAVEQEPKLSQAKDRDVFDFLRSRADFPGTLPPSFQTFNRYLGAARLFHDRRKRALKKRLSVPVKGSTHAVAAKEGQSP
jgi:hypothetical protein